jgi:hypothetical protein
VEKEAVCHGRYLSLLLLVKLAPIGPTHKISQACVICHDKNGARVLQVATVYIPYHSVVWTTKQIVHAVCSPGFAQCSEFESTC